MKIVTDLSITGRPARRRDASPAAAGLAFDTVGIHFDPARIDTLFQDAAGTVPVTGDGQPVGRILDLSGHGLDATQSISAARPLWRSDGSLAWLDFDGADDWLSVPSVVFAGAPVMSVVCAASKVEGSNNGPVVELTNSFATPGAFAVVANGGSLANWTFNATTSKITTFRAGTPAFAATSVLHAKWDVSVAQTNLVQQLSLRVDASPQSVAGAGTGAGGFATAPLFIGRRNGTGVAWAGRLYGLAAIARAMTSPEIESIETFLAQRSGVLLS